MDDENKDKVNNIYPNGNLDLKNIISNANFSGSSDSYFDN